MSKDNLIHVFLEYEGSRKLVHVDPYSRIYDLREKVITEFNKPNNQIKLYHINADLFQHEAQTFKEYFKSKKIVTITVKLYNFNENGRSLKKLLQLSNALNKISASSNLNSSLFEFSPAPQPKNQGAVKINKASQGLNFGQPQPINIMENLKNLNKLKRINSKSMNEALFAASAMRLSQQVMSQVKDNKVIEDKTSHLNDLQQRTPQLEKKEVPRMITLKSYKKNNSISSEAANTCTQNLPRINSLKRESKEINLRKESKFQDKTPIYKSLVKASKIRFAGVVFKKTSNDSVAKSKRFSIAESSDPTLLINMNRRFSSKSQLNNYSN